MKLFSKLFSNNKNEFDPLYTVDMKEYSGLTIIGTEKELNQLPLKVQALAHNIFERKSDGSLILKKMRNFPCKTITIYWGKEGYGRVPQKDGKHRKNDKYAVWG